jgi:hypothetical protein
MFPENSDRSVLLSNFDSNPIIRAIRESEYLIASASAVIRFCIIQSLAPSACFD